MNKTLKKCVQLWINYTTGYFKDSDRGNIIIGCAILDEWLEEIILTIHSDKEKVITKYVKYPGPISSFAARIDYLFLRGQLDEKTHRALHKLRELRNDMAHKSDHLNFQTPSVKDKIEAIAKEIKSDKESGNIKSYFHGIITKIYLSMSYSFLEMQGIKRDKVLAEWESVRQSIIKSTGR